jgi:hypothetical protein
MNDDEIMVLMVQAGQVKEAVNGCPSSCFAAPFLENYAKLFALYENQAAELKELKIRHGKLERRLIAAHNWQRTVDEVSEPKGR